MASEKTPVLLAVVVNTSRQQWFVAGVDFDGSVDPLVRSEPGNLDHYADQPGDEQLSFLRHRLSGSMQRGCDRLWARNAKAARIVLIVDDDFPGGEADLLVRLAEHFHVWMTSPPVSCYRGAGGVSDLESFDCLVGEPEPEQAAALGQALPTLFQRMTDADLWEVIQDPKT